jgi:hypothetical protein
VAEENPTTQDTIMPAISPPGDAKTLSCSINGETSREEEKRRRERREERYGIPSSRRKDVTSSLRLRLRLRSRISFKYHVVRLRLRERITLTLIVVRYVIRMLFVSVLRNRIRDFRKVNPPSGTKKTKRQRL